jgi:hypothetical protein
LFDKTKVKKQLKKYVPTGMIPTTFFSMNSPDFIESTIADVLKESNMDYTVDNSKYKIVFTQTGAVEDPGSEEGIEKYSIQIQVKISEIDDKRVAVEFQRISGDQV